MKRFIIAVLFGLISFVGYSQISYEGTYNNPQSIEKNSQTASITAYSLDYNGVVIRLRIKVKITTSQYSEKIQVTEFYSISTMNGSQWMKLGTPALATKCSPYSSNPLEQQLMYKVSIPGKGRYYFDL